MINNLILDNSILIDLNFGTKRQQYNCNQKLDFLPYKKYILKITLGEFVRTVLQTSIKIINYINQNIKELDDYNSFEEFMDDISIDIPSFSLHEKDRIIKIINLMKKRLKKIFRIYESSKISFHHAIDSIIDDLIHYKIQFLKEIEIIDNSYFCNDSSNSIIFDPIKHSVSFKNIISCNNNRCKENSLKYFLEKYRKEIEIIEESLNLKKIKVDKNFIEAFQILIHINELNNIDGRKHYCYKLIDFFLILETPRNYIIYTTNIKHFKEIVDILDKEML